MLGRLILAAILAIGFATGTGAAVVPRGIGTVGSVTPSLVVYPGCAQPPSTPDSYTTSKDWYFNPNPSIGHPPAYYNGVASITGGSGGPSTYTQYNNVALTGGTGSGATARIVVQGGSVIDVLPISWGAGGYTNGDVLSAASGSIGGTTGFSFIYRTPDPESVWGNATHPFDNPTAIGGMAGFNQWPLGWGGGTYQVLSGIAWYNNRSNATVRDFDCWDPATPSCVSPLETGDPNHYRLWPGDTVYLQGDNSFTWQSSNVGLPFGITNGGLTGYVDSYTDASGNPVWVWIKNDPSKPTPQLYNVLVAGGVNGVIIQGLAAGHANTGITSTHPSTALPFGALVFNSVPVLSGGETLQLGASGDTIDELWTYENTVSAGNQILINGSWLDTMYNTYNELLADSTAPSVLQPTFNGTPYSFSYTASVTYGANPSPSSTVSVMGDTWTYVSSVTGANQILIAAALKDTLTNAVAALGPQYPGISFSSTSTKLSWSSASASHLFATNPTASSTITIGNIAWEFVASSPGPNQILIGADLNTTLGNAVTTLDAQYPGVIFTNTGTSSTANRTLGWNFSPQPTLQFTSNQTAVTPGSQVYVDGVDYTMVSGTPSGNQIQIGSSLNNTYANINVRLPLIDAKIASTALLQPTGIQLTSPLFGAAGAHLVRFTGISEPISLEKSGATLPALFPQNMLNDKIVQLSGSNSNPTNNVIFDSLNVGSTDIGVPYTGLYANYFPTSGSLGYNLETGVHGTPGGAWNLWDINAQEAEGIYLSGSYYAPNGPNKSSTQIDGATCVTATNNYLHHAFTLEFNDVKNGLAQSNIINYSANDDMDSYGAIYTNWNSNLVLNGIYAENGVHSDGFQTGTGAGFTLGDMGNTSYFPAVIGYPGIFAPQIQFTRNKFYATTDASLASSTFHDMFNSDESMANALLSWTQGTEPIIDSVYADNQFYDAGEVQFAIVLNTVFANNTGLVPGVPSTEWGSGNQFVGLKTEFSSVQPYPAGNSYYNNLLNTMDISGVSGRSCAARNDTFASNLLIPPISNGSITANVNYNGCTITNSGTINFSAGGTTNKSAESCGVIVNPQPGVAAACGFPTITNFAPFLMQAYTPLNTGMYDPTTLNAQPPGYSSAPTGPLVGAGTAATGVPTTNVDGLAWPHAAPNIGAY